MNIFDYFKNLEIRERKILADEVGCSLGYINQMVSTRQSLSNKLAEKIEESDFNQSLPEQLRLTKDDLIDYRILRTKQEKKTYTRQA